MRTAWVLALVVAACGSPPRADDVTAAPGGEATQACLDGGTCEEGLVCRGSRGTPLCLPAAWFTGAAGAYCDRDSDCGTGLTCDTGQSPEPVVDGVCRVSTHN